MRILIAYHSDYGSTEKMAQAISAGASASQTDCKVTVKQAADTSLNDLEKADVILFGTPVHMGSMAWPMKKLVDETSKLWMENTLEGKVGGVFATGGGLGSAGGGIEQTLISLHSNFLEHGMVVIGFPKSLPGYADAGLHWGVCARTSNHEGMPQGISDAALVAARSYGAHVAAMAAHILGADL
ncbi:MAG: NAD(P)H-dependent oxidoreductase [Mariprofundaceae bacterium]|nr:NAD(P)H-dependent oxidoreductase [Mariprofundaceae bacterium]